MILPEGIFSSNYPLKFLLSISLGNQDFGICWVSRIIGEDSFPSSRPSYGKMLEGSQVNPFYLFWARSALVCDVSKVSNMNREEHRIFSYEGELNAFPEQMFFKICGGARRFAFQNSKIC